MTPPPTPPVSTPKRLMLFGFVAFGAVLVGIVVFVLVNLLQPDRYDRVTVSDLIEGNAVPVPVTPLSEEDANDRGRALIVAVATTDTPERYVGLGIRSTELRVTEVVGGAVFYARPADSPDTAPVLVHLNELPIPVGTDVGGSHQVREGQVLTADAIVRRLDPDRLAAWQVVEGAREAAGRYPVYLDATSLDVSDAQ